jgi:post-segregation antitoxin (ccd killing protein)
MNIQGTLLDIMSSSWTTAGITQTSNWPCAQNIITVSIAASIDVDKECVNRLTISGLRGSTTADATISADCAPKTATVKVVHARMHTHAGWLSTDILGWQYTLTKRGPHKASSISNTKSS